MKVAAECPECPWFTFDRYGLAGIDALAEHLDHAHERRARDRSGVAPVRPNDWRPAAGVTRIIPSIWCRRGLMVPRRHHAGSFVIFDVSLPHYRRCVRCGQTIYRLHA
jgi:hypothetical protein